MGFRGRGTGVYVVESRGVQKAQFLEEDARRVPTEDAFP
jgi:hypothetical protein